jgi:hypothetical protein
MNRKKIKAPLTMSAVLALLGACDGIGPEEQPGIAHGWEVGTELQILAGSLDSPSELSFNGVAGVARLGTGEIVVLDGGLESRLTLLTQDGEFIRTIGRPGEGPGEYGWVTSVVAGANDSLFVFDAGQQRLTVFSPDGSAARMASYRPVDGERLRSVTPLGGQSWLGRGLDTPLRGSTDQIRQDTIVLGLLDSNLDEINLLAALPSLMTVTQSIRGRMAWGAVPFTPIALHATWGGCVFVSTADSDEWCPPIPLEASHLFRSKWATCSN